MDIRAAILLFLIFHFAYYDFFHLSAEIKLALILTVLFSESVYRLLAQKPPPPPPPSIDDSQKLLETILDSRAPIEDKKKAGVLLDQIDRLEK
ncbi:mechanosensitive ion channel protein [Desulfonema ishimotonii]|uniref:Mechanosensitive ion channel protein n=1 Tax=Desulfonema ishimotonii TaxID=45657 RepID=A0A401G3T3_9BACT|nr:hypothetical protein [Desulfonema ishimotonii]GBC63902.1 mechanosensitive ion channel protein [Desulfonema ishimotonii]